MSVTWSELNELWKWQTSTVSQWKNELQKEAILLMESIKEKIKAPNGFSKKHGQSGNYVELIDLNDHQKPLDINYAINEKGEVVFGIAIAFEYKPEAYPKRFFHVPAAIKFQDKKPCYALWNTDTRMPESWHSERDEFVNKVITLFHENFQLDPFDGISKEAKQIKGFIWEG